MKVLLAGCVLISILVTGVRAANETKRPVVYVGYAPEQVYAIIHSAKLRVEAKMVLGSMSERSSATEASVHEEIMLGRSRLPQGLRLIEKKVENDRLATLLYLGQRTDRETGQEVFSRGTVTMVKEEGTWRLRHETWEDIPNPYMQEE